jgi:hypothetical protein
MRFSKPLLTSLAAIAVVAAMGMGGAAQAAERENTVRAGVLVNGVGTVTMVEYERLLSKNFAAGVRAGRLTYDWEDDSYDESGDGSGIELIASFYPKGEGFKGFYLAAGLGYWNTDWTWTDPNDFPTSGFGKSEAVDVNFSVGWKIPLGSPSVYIQPSVLIGNFFSSTSESSTAEHESELGFYASVGLHVGGSF